MSLSPDPPPRQKSVGGWGIDWVELIFDGGIEALFYLLRFVGHLVVVALHAIFHL